MRSLVLASLHCPVCHDTRVLLLAGRPGLRPRPRRVACPHCRWPHLAILTAPYRRDIPSGASA